MRGGGATDERWGIVPKTEFGGGGGAKNSKIGDPAQACSLLLLTDCSRRDARGTLARAATSPPAIFDQRARRALVCVPPHRARCDALGSLGCARHSAALGVSSHSRDAQAFAADGAKPPSPTRFLLHRRLPVDIRLLGAGLAVAAAAYLIPERPEAKWRQLPPPPKVEEWQRRPLGGGLVLDEPASLGGARDEGALSASSRPEPAPDILPPGDAHAPDPASAGSEDAAEAADAPEAAPQPSQSEEARPSVEGGAPTRPPASPGSHPFDALPLKSEEDDARAHAVVDEDDAPPPAPPAASAELAALERARAAAAEERALADVALARLRAAEAEAGERSEATAADEAVSVVHAAMAAGAAAAKAREAEKAREAAAAAGAARVPDNGGSIAGVEAAHSERRDHVAAAVPAHVPADGAASLSNVPPPTLSVGDSAPPSPLPGDAAPPVASFEEAAAVREALRAQALRRVREEHSQRTDAARRAARRAHAAADAIERATAAEGAAFEAAKAAAGEAEAARMREAVAAARHAALVAEAKQLVAQRREALAAAHAIAAKAKQRTATAAKSATWLAYASSSLSVPSALVKLEAAMEAPHGASLSAAKRAVAGAGVRVGGGDGRLLSAVASALPDAAPPRWVLAAELAAAGRRLRQLSLVPRVVPTVPTGSTTPPPPPPLQPATDADLGVQAELQPPMEAEAGAAAAAAQSRPGVASRALALLASFLRVREPSPTDSSSGVEATLGRAAAALAEGRLGDAADALEAGLRGTEAAAEAAPLVARLRARAVAEVGRDAVRAVALTRLTSLQA